MFLTLSLLVSHMHFPQYGRGTTWCHSLGSTFPFRFCRHLNKSMFHQGGLTHVRSSTDRTQQSLGLESRIYRSHPHSLFGSSMPKHGIYFVQTAVLWLDSCCTPERSYPGDWDPGGTAAQNLRRKKCFDCGKRIHTCCWCWHWCNV